MSGGSGSVVGFDAGAGDGIGLDGPGGRFGFEVCNYHRSIGARLSGEIARLHGNDGMHDAPIDVQLTGTAGQSFGAFVAHGVSIELIGEGNDYVGNLHIMEPDGSNVRRICFEQDNDWYPAVMNNGRVMYLRWEYTDSAHYFSRVLMSMNPDGTELGQRYNAQGVDLNRDFPDEFVDPVNTGDGRAVETGLVMAWSAGRNIMPRDNRRRILWSSTS